MDRQEQYVRRVEAWASLTLTGVALVYALDAALGGRLRAWARRGWDRARARATARPGLPVPAPRDVSAVLSEASEITRRAARGGPDA